MVESKWSIDEQSAKYELAIGLIDEMVGLRSSWIGEEYQKKDRNEVSISTWREEQRALGKERSDLDPDDSSQIKLVIERYSPILRAVYKK